VNPRDQAAMDAEMAYRNLLRRQQSRKRETLVLEIAGRVQRWRFITGERRAELILLLDDLLKAVQETEDAS